MKKVSDVFIRIFMEKDENGLGQLNDRGVVMMLLLIVGIACVAGWALDGL